MGGSKNQDLPRGHRRGAGLRGRQQAAYLQPNQHRNSSLDDLGQRVDVVTRQDESLHRAHKRLTQEIVEIKRAATSRALTGFIYSTC